MLNLAQRLLDDTDQHNLNRSATARNIHLSCRDHNMCQKTCENPMKSIVHKLKKIKLQVPFFSFSSLVVNVLSAISWAFNLWQKDLFSGK
jgi:hypothetical protein